MSDRNRILIIEDDEGIRDGVRILFENEGYEVIETGTGTDGLRLLDEQTDLLILDKGICQIICDETLYSGRFCLAIAERA